MARVMLHERAVNAIHTVTPTDETSNKETQDGIKTKEELIDATISTNTTDSFKFLRSCSKMSDSDKSLLSENNDVPCKHVNHETTEIVPDNRSEDSDRAGLPKISHPKSKSTRSRRDPICNTSPIPNKKRKYCDKVSANGYGNASNTTKTTKHFNRKRKRSKTGMTFKKVKVKLVTQCDVCYIRFRTTRNRKLHYQYYMKTGNFQCTYCKEYFSLRGALRTHIIAYHRNKPVDRPYCPLMYCHFCNRPFKLKSYLQSHLFHCHNELIYSNNTNETKNDRNDVHEESSCSSDSDESIESNTINKNYEQSPNDTEKVDDKSFEDSDFVADDFSSSDDEQVSESPEPKLPEEAEHDRQVNISSEKSSNDLGQVTQVSTSEQNEKLEECSSKEPFVKLHADVETIKYFLETLPDEDAKSGVSVSQNQTNNATSLDHDMPYSLRPVRAIRFLGHLTRKYVFKKFQPNTRSNIAETEQRIVDLDTANSEPSKTITVPLKYKDFTISLERCDKKLRNCHLTSTTQATLEQGLVPSITEPNSAQSEKNDVRNDVVLKELEISLERLETEQAEDDLELETDAEKQDSNSFRCGICKKIFSTKSDKRLHIKSSHLAYMSSICNARYTMRNRLLLHYLREHTFRPNQCCVCNEICDPNRLKQHLTYHCLKYFQNEDDQYPLNVDLKCSVKASNTCFKCGKILPSHMLWTIHDRYCRISGEVEEVQQDLKETNLSSEMILQANYNEDVDENIVIRDEKIQYDALCTISNDNFVEEPTKIRPTPINQMLINNEEEIIEEPTIIEEDQEINGSNQNPLSRKTIFIVENIGDVNEPQQSTKFPTINNSIHNSINNSINVQTTASVQSNAPEPNGKTYPCDICGKRFQSKKNLDQHIRSFSRVTDFCPLCNTAFSSKRYLQTHIASAHVPQLSKNYDYHCVFCNQGFVKKYDLRPHVLHLHGRQMLETIMPNFRSNQGKDDDLDNGNATCSVCNLAFETLDRYVEHRMYYYKNHKFRCSICLKDFQGMYMYHHHNKLTHYPEDKRKSYSYTCNVCKEGFNHELHFHSHNMHVHSNEESSPEVTDLSGGNKQVAVDVEEIQEQVDVQEVQEEVNGGVIDLSMNQQKKIEEPSSTDLFVNQQKQIEEPSSTDLSMNQQKQIEESSSTDLSMSQQKNIEEPSSTDLSMNQQKESEKPSSTDYICQICELKYTNANDLENHQLIYSNDGDFKCDLCSRRCKTADLLEQHNGLTHGAGRCFKKSKCQSCGEVLPSIIALNCHKKHFHNLTSLDNCKNCGQTFFSDTEFKEHQCKSGDTTSTDTDTISTGTTSTTATNIGTTSTVITSSVITSTVITSTATTSGNTSGRSKEKYIYRCFYCDMKFTSLELIQTHIIHVHFSKLLVKHATLKSDLFIVSEDKTQKRSIPQLIDQVIVSRKNLTQSFQQSGNDPNSTSTTQEAQNKVAIEPTPDQLKPLFLIDNEPNQKTPIPTITANGSEGSVSTMMEKEQDNQDALIAASTETTNRPKSRFLSDTFNISLEQMLDGHSIFTTGSTNKSNVAFPSAPSKPVNEPIVPTAVATIPRNEEIALQKCVSVNDTTDYICPLCRLQYPSLMYFHAHLRFSHADLIRNDLIYPQLDQLTEKIPAIECLLCPRISTDEKRYKRHLRHSHSSSIFFTSFEGTSKIDNASTSSTTLTNSNTRSKSPEVITVEDDDDDDNNSKNSLVEQAAAETPIETKHTPNTSSTPSTGNENVGKLKVKSFAKIIENLAIDRAIELLNTPKSSNTSDDVSTK